MILHLRKGTTAAVADEFRRRLAAATGREVSGASTGLGLLLTVPGFERIDDPAIRSLVEHDAVFELSPLDHAVVRTRRLFRSEHDVILSKNSSLIIQ